MEYKSVITAVFLSRPNRFVAKVLVDGKEDTAHVKNTGRCKELLVPGCTVYLEDHSLSMGKRKYRYSLIAVLKERENGTLLVNMDSQAPNKAAYEALSVGTIKIPGTGELTYIRPETVYGDSRFDFYFEDNEGRKGFAEVKGCTLEKGGIASFPDAPTERGVKHIEELIKAKKDGYYASLIFIVQMEGMKYIRPNDETHPAFGEALRRAAKAGVSVAAYECRVFPCAMTVSKEVPVSLAE
ncbi:MAG: DNA/RNA nuclease SfsA [Firmicutes bacterium]|nr:DNA/RNA nuclease SfsA [Bacillota bacterium]